MKQKKKMSTRNIWLIGIACTLLFIIGTVVIYDNFRYTLNYLTENKTLDNNKENNSSLNEDDNIKEEKDEEDNNGGNEEYFSNFVNLSDVEIIYSTKLEQYDCEINSNGFLQGACAIEELKNKRFINLMPGNDDFSGNVLALAMDGFIYDIGFDSTDAEMMVLKDKIKPLENIQKMAYIKNDLLDCRDWYQPVYTIDDKEYMLDLSAEDIEKAEYILVSEAKQNNMPVYSVSPCSYIGDGIFADDTFSINRNLILKNDLIVKDNETKTAIEVKYSVYQYINGKENLHIISNDNKYYILNEESEFVTKEANITKIDLQDNYLTLNLEDGRMVVLTLYS